jgi:hypothetical protein
VNSGRHTAGQTFVSDYPTGGGRDARIGRKGNLCGLRCPATLSMGTPAKTEKKNHSGARMASKRPDAPGVRAANNIAARHRMTINLRAEVNTPFNGI